MNRARAGITRAAAVPRGAGLLLLLTVLVAGCSAATTSPDASATAAPTGVASAPAPTSAPPPTGDPSSATPDPAPTAPPSDEPPPSDAPTPSDLPTPTPGPAARCSGTDANRDFFAAVAAAVDWEVYCAVLPDGWFVDSGSYRLSHGARLEIVYRGPAGARLELREGAFCGRPDGCAPDGAAMGSAAFADRDGELIAAEAGRWSVVVEPGSVVSWLLIAEGMDEVGVRDLAASLAEVAD